MKVKKKTKSNNNPINNNNIIITESNTTITTTYNKKINNKVTSLNKNKKSKEVPKLEGVESVDKKKLTINRKIVNNYLTATQKKKTFQGRFHIHENSESINNFTHKQIVETNNININNTEKMEFINVCNTMENNNNPIKFKLDQKNLIKKKAKTNSLQINNKNEFLSSFNLVKDKTPINTNEIDVINLDEKMVKYKKKSLKKLMNNKTQTNSEAELIKDINKNRNILNTIASKSLKKEKIIKKMKQYNNVSSNNNKTIIENTEPIKEVKKINVKEMKEKYHKLLRGNKNNHGSYDIANRLHLFKKFKGLNNIMDNMTNSINNTISNNKRSRLMKKSVLSPSERLQNSMNNFIKSPIQKRFETNKEIHTIEVNNLGNKFKLIGKKNKQMDTNNKKMKFLKK